MIAMPVMIINMFGRVKCQCECAEIREGGKLGRSCSMYMYMNACPRGRAQVSLVRNSSAISKKYSDHDSHKYTMQLKNIILVCDI